MARKHKRQNNRSAKAQRTEKLSGLKFCDIYNDNIIEARSRQDLNSKVKHKKILVDPRNCPILYKSPTLKRQDAERYMRHSQYRVIEKDLKLY